MKGDDDDDGEHCYVGDDASDDGGYFDVIWEEIRLVTMQIHEEEVIMYGKV